MSLTSLLARRAWIAVLLIALFLLAWSNVLRMKRVSHVTTIVPSDAVVAAASSTGYAGEIRNLLLPEQGSPGFHWIAQTQQMLARGEARVRKIDYENAPVGREVYTPSPYRWWLGMVAWISHDVSGRPLGRSVEHATLLTDPLMLGLLVVVAVTLTAWRFGAWPAALLSLAMIAMYPFAAGFVPGLPEDKTLSRSAILLSLLLLASGFKSAQGPTAGKPRKAGRWFIAAAIVGALGLWISVGEQMPIVVGIGLGGMLAAVLARRGGVDQILPSDWLKWGIAGAMTSLACYLVEYYPGYLGSWRLEFIHPVYSVAWLGWGGAAALTTAWSRRELAGWSGRTVGFAALALAAIATLPGFMWKEKSMGFFGTELWSLRLSRLPGSPEAASLWAWVNTEGGTSSFVAAVLPLLIVICGGWLLFRRTTSAANRSALAVGIVPVLVALGFACGQIGRWSSVDAALLALLVVVTVVVGEASRLRIMPWVWAGLVALLLLPGWYRLLPDRSPEKAPLNESELAGLISRDLAHWLARHTGPGTPVVLAPPDETMALSYYGSLRGIGTVSRENQEGIGAAVRIFSAMTPQEALARVQQRGVTHIVLPSWNRYLDEYVRLGVIKADDAFLTGLRNWAPISWLKPVPYELPAVSGYEGQYVAVFEIVEEQNEATILSWQAEYFAELGQLEYADALSKSLQRFPNDLGAWVARGLVAIARQDGPGLDEVVRSLVPRVAAGADRNLAWDRRAGLAVVLAQGKQMDAAREQLRRCFADLTEKRLRSASTSTIYRLLVIGKTFELEIPRPELKSLAMELLPPDWRARF